MMPISLDSIRLMFTPPGRPVPRRRARYAAVSQPAVPPPTIRISLICSGMDRAPGAAGRTEAMLVHLRQQGAMIRHAGGRAA